MWDALVAAILVAVTTRAGEDIGDAARFTWTTALRKVRERLGARQELIDADDPAALEEALRPLVDEDPAFAARVQSLVSQALRERGEAPLAALTVPSPALPAAGSAPRLLPAGPPDFVNRIAALATLDEIAGRVAPGGGAGDRATAGGDAGATPVVVLRGAPGAGKTALALRWGHRRQEWFDGGQLYADLRELPGPALGGPEPTDAVVTSFLLAMGVPGGLLPDTVAGRLAAYRARTAERPVLVLLRGAALPAQISPLIPTAPGSLVLVSTGHDVRGLAMDGARFLDVGPLDAEAALELLAAGGHDRIAADPVAGARLAELCGRLPVALRIVAGRLRVDPDLSAAELAGELAAEPYLLGALALPGEGNAVEPLFTHAYRHLGGDAQRLYRDLGALPVAGITDDLVARIGWPGRAARRAAIDELLGRRLLERSAPGRYALHPLIRAHAARLARETDSDHADRVVAETVGHYCDYAESADQAIMGDRRRLTVDRPRTGGPFTGPDRRAAALRALERDREDLLRVARIALAAGEDVAVTRLGTAAQALYMNHRHLADWIAMSGLTVTAARRIDRPDIEVQVRCLLSRAYADAGDLGRARAEMEHVVALLPATDDRPLAGTAWEFVARVRDLIARVAPEPERAAALEAAGEAFRTAIDIYLEVGSARGVALARLFLGVHLDATGRAGEALPVLEEARKGLNTLGDDRNATRADAAIGVAHLRLGRPQRAYEELTTAAAYFAAAELWHYELEVRDALVLAATALGDRVAAAGHAERAAEIRRLSEPGE
ncbi:hypothetical protein [Actinoplanes sp. NPDC051851]|uniref:hypothetical protein n=1 Tax=Actinoplanes sp. NPDC051851 TaxID=3154753 RepID=UPI00341A51D4